MSPRLQAGIKDGGCMAANGDEASMIVSTLRDAPAPGSPA
jgi:hypothetical protein